jgi:hypothetical protein
LSRIAVFVGPSAHGLGDLLGSLDPRVTLLPPIARGELEQLDKEYATVLIVDGFFHARPAVGHKEILRSLASRRVFGCSSMGAIRAAEMAPFGMAGIGEIALAFRRDAEFRDDEVALIHLPCEPYTSLSEPLVNLRWALSAVVAADGCDPHAAAAVIDDLRALYYGYRTSETIDRIMIGHLGAAGARAVNESLCVGRLKSIDFLEALYNVTEDDKWRAHWSALKASSGWSLLPDEWIAKRSSCIAASVGR